MLRYMQVLVKGRGWRERLEGEVGGRGWRERLEGEVRGRV